MREFSCKSKLFSYRAMVTVTRPQCVFDDI